MVAVKVNCELYITFSFLNIHNDMCIYVHTKEICHLIKIIVIIKIAKYWWNTCTLYIGTYSDTSLVFSFTHVLELHIQLDDI